jgi:IMP cyclohydrolase
MKNPNGPYPGRQLFVGLTSEKKPCFAYLITGRSPASRERIATQVENSIRIGPVGSVQYDPLRHYSAVKHDSLSGILTVSNGIQTEAIFETYKLLHNTGNHPGQEYLEKILEGAGAEPDPPLNTARIAGVITNDAEGDPILMIGIKAYDQPARAWQIESESGTITGISTYNGEIEKPEPPDLDTSPPILEFAGRSSRDLAEFLFDISGATYKGSDIRVCALGGIRSGKKWDIAIKNVLMA